VEYAVVRVGALKAVGTVLYTVNCNSDEVLVPQVLVARSLTL
jgi:hypothetical protein